MNDDYFGSTLASSGERLLIGAPSEGAISEYGMAYFLDIQSLGVNDAQQKRLSVYPNPVHDALLINTFDNLQITRTEIVSMTGQILYSEAGSPSSISFKDFAVGIYLVKFYGENGTVQTHKIIKN